MDYGAIEKEGVPDGPSTNNQESQMPSAGRMIKLVIQHAICNAVLALILILLWIMFVRWVQITFQQLREARATGFPVMCRCFLKNIILGVITGLISVLTKYFEYDDSVIFNIAVAGFLIGSVIIIVMYWNPELNFIVLIYLWILDIIYIIAGLFIANILVGTHETAQKFSPGIGLTILLKFPIIFFPNEDISNFEVLYPLIQLNAVLNSCLIHFLAYLFIEAIVYTVVVAVVVIIVQFGINL